MLGLTAQRRAFDIVISDIERVKASLCDFQESLSKYGFKYYMIIHDKDIDNQGGLIRSHIHLVIVSMKTLRVKQLINLLSDSLITNPENIQVQEVVSLAGSIQYLIHLNDCNKYQYSKDCIITNDSDNIDGYLLERPAQEQLTTKRLMDLVLIENVSRIELMESIGIGAYTHYIRVIDELYNFKRGKEIV